MVGAAVRTVPGRNYRCVLGDSIGERIVLRPFQRFIMMIGPSKTSAVPFLMLVLTRFVRSLFLLTGNESESGVDCTITSVGARFDLCVIRFRIWREMRGFIAASFDSKSPHILVFVLFCRLGVIQKNYRRPI